jgi:hypothetical protein
MKDIKDKLSHWLLSSVALPAILVPLLLVETGSIAQAEGFKPKQLIAQSCRNIEIRSQPGGIIKKGRAYSTCGYKLQFQGDGNLVLLNKSGKVLWATGTEGRGERLVMQADGNLVIYDSSNKPLWATNTDRNPRAFFAIQGDGNLVIYTANGKPLWGSGTERGQARTTNAGGEWQAASNPQPKPTDQPSNPPPRDDYMGTYFKDGSIIRLSNVAGPVINLHFQQNGGMINSWGQDPNDDDQKFRVSRNGGTNQIKLIRVNSSYLVSTKETFSDQAALESWKDIGGFHPNQTWYVDAANTPGTFWLKPLGNPAYAMNLPYGGNNRKLTISNFNPNDPDQKFTVAALGIAPPPPPPLPGILNDKFSSFFSQNDGRRVADPGGYYPGECVSLVKQWGAFIGRGQGYWPGDYPRQAFNAYQSGDRRMVGNDGSTSIISDWHQLKAGDIIIMQGAPSHTGIASGKLNGSQYEMFDQNSPRTGDPSHLHMYDGSKFIGAIRYN